MLKIQTCIWNWKCQWIQNFCQISVSALISLHLLGLIAEYSRWVVDHMPLISFAICGQCTVGGASSTTISAAAVASRQLGCLFSWHRDRMENWPQSRAGAGVRGHPGPLPLDYLLFLWDTVGSAAKAALKDCIQGHSAQIGATEIGMLSPIGHAGPETPATACTTWRWILQVTHLLEPGESDPRQYVYSTMCANKKMEPIFAFYR